VGWRLFVPVPASIDSLYCAYITTETCTFASFSVGIFFPNIVKLGIYAGKTWDNMGQLVSINRMSIVLNVTI
jgi:hypothetical protein